MQEGKNMKRILALFLLGTISTFLFACSSSQSVSSSDIEPSSEAILPEVVSSEAPDNSSVQNSSIPSNKEFDLTREQFVKAQDSALKSKNLTLLSDIQSSVKETDWPDVGNCLGYTYSFGDTGSLDLMVDKNNDKLIAISYFFNNKSKAIDLEKANPTYYWSVINTLAYMATSEAEAQSLLEELKIYNISEDSIKVAETQFCDFSYIVNSGTAMFTITPKS